MPERFRKKRAIMIRVPRTGSTSVSRVLFPDNPGHVPFADYIAAIGRPGVRRHFTFGFTRNPFDRLVSTFEYLRGGGYGNGYDQSLQDQLRDYDFDRLVTEWLPRNVGARMHFLPQTHWLSDADGRVAVGFVGRFERLERDFAIVARTLKTRARLPRLNQSRRGPWQDYYNERTLAIVARLYARDFATFGYHPRFPQRGHG